jgi:hypothetical protein
MDEKTLEAHVSDIDVLTSADFVSVLAEPLLQLSAFPR